MSGTIARKNNDPTTPLGHYFRETLIDARFRVNPQRFRENSSREGRFSLGHSWFNRFRKLSPRYEKTARAYLGLVMLAAAMIALNKVIAIYG
jgi:transposase